MKKISDFLLEASKQGQRILVLCHHNADPDAVGSSLALADALNQLGARAEAGVSESIGLMAKSVLQAAGREITVDPKLDVDIIVLVDTSSFEHLGELGEKVRQKAHRIVVVDHHRPVEGMEELVDFYYVKESAASESEIVLELIQELGAKVTPEMAFLLLAGIVSDTGQFRLAKDETFAAVQKLIEAGASYGKVLEALKMPEDMSKRVAMLKAAQRSVLHKVDGRLIVFSELSSFEADAAAMFVRMGADIAIVGSEEKGKIRLCGRAREGFCKEVSLHLGEIMSELGKEFGGTGGGHAGAASMTGKGKLSEAKERLLKVLRQSLKKQ
jgi:nanoRNase/pAp phosphatase (c-di-AMP/oligoRNAs hydrolase)